jgi:uncharacterized membrane protein YgdD (TMEM256/DUF423 family)
MFRRRDPRDLSWLERSCFAIAFIAAALAAYGAFGLVARMAGRLTALSGAAAMLIFFATLALMLKGVDAMKDERIRRLIKEAEERLPPEI